MVSHAPDSIPPALALLRRIAARGLDGLSHRALLDDGMPSPVASRLLDALRSRGYVRFDRTTGRWVATLSGARRVDQPPAKAPGTLSRR
jgi:DNA-binding IclR family transcriptional regulator